MKLHQALLALRHFNRNGFTTYYKNNNLRLVLENSIVSTREGCMCPVTYLIWVKLGLYRDMQEYSDGQELLDMDFVKLDDRVIRVADVIANAADGQTYSNWPERNSYYRRVRRIICQIFSIHEGNPETAWGN